MHRLKLSKVFAMLGVATVCALSVLGFSKTVYAGTSWSGGIGNPVGEGSSAIAMADQLSWKPLNSYARGAIGGSAANADIGVYLVAGHWDDTAWARWDKILGRWYFGYGNGSSASRIDPFRGWDGRLVETAVKNGYSVETRWVRSYGGEMSQIRWWYKGGSSANMLDAAWIEERTVEKDEPKKVITYSGGGDGNHVDDRDKTAEWLYNNGQTSLTYHDKTSPNETNHHTDVDAIIQVINKHSKVRQKMGDDGVWHDISSEVTYSKQGVQKFHKDIDYKTVTPELTKENYVPYNLNRNGYATSEDIQSSYANADKKLDATINNNQGITDGSTINSIDINSDTNFEFKFNNSSFGMPSEYNWNNTPAELANGTYEYSGSDYANNRNSAADHDGMIRYNLTFNASITTNRKNPSIDSASLNVNGEEVTASNSITKKEQGDSTFTGGTWSTRFTYADTYKTDSDSDKFNDWWVNTYNQGRFYEYGTEYSGNITTSGIENPNSISHGNGYTDGNKFVIEINANKQDRGLYVGLASQKYEQPVLIGTWEVKTIAGDIN